MVIIYGTFNIRNVTSNFKNFLNAKFGYVSTHCVLKLSVQIVTPRKLPAKRHQTFWEESLTVRLGQEERAITAR